MTTVRATFELTTAQINTLVRDAMQLGYRRARPGARWSREEKLDACRYTIKQLVARVIDEDGDDRRDAPADSAFGGFDWAAKDC